MTDATIHMHAPIQIEASATDKPARVSVMAYAGGIMMRVSRFGPVAVDLAGLTIPSTVNLLVDHDGTLRGVCGTGTPRIDRGTLRVDGTLSRSSESANQIIALDRDGVRFGASVGVDPSDVVQVRPGETVQVNGQTITADGNGFKLVRRGVLREVSIVALPADGSTSVAISASLLQRGQNMSIDQTTDTTITADPTNDTTITADPTAEIRAAAAGEHARCDEITRICGKHHAIAAEAIRDAWTPADAKLAVLRASRAPMQTVDATGLRGSDGRNVAEAALLAHLGAEHVAEKAFGEQTLQAARDMHCTSLVECIQAAWNPNEMGDMPRGREPMLKAAFSQALISNLLSNVQNKMLLDQWRRFPALATKLARVISAADFKTHHLMRLVGSNTIMEELSETGEIRHGAIKDSDTTVQVATYAKMFALTRTDIINDDLSALDELPRVVARGSALKLESLFWQMILGNANAFFHADNNNLTDAVLGTAGLATGVSLMRSLVDDEGLPVLVEPKYLVVPPALESTADSLYVSRNLAVAGATDTIQGDANTFARKYTPLVSPYLSTTGFHANVSATQWYLFSDPTAGPAAFVVAFLNGQQAPTVEISEGDFNRLGMQIRGFHDFGVAQLDPQGAVKSSGDAT